MSESQMAPGKGLGQTLESIAKGGLLRLLVSKPVQQAIGRLIYGFVDVPVAKLEQWAQGIRSETVARKQMVTAIAAKARVQAAENPEIVERGMERWTNQLGRRQEARENVALRTLALFAGETLLPVQLSEPSEEFMGLFEDIAERASSDDLADLMARILAGEIRKPKSVSRRTLQVAAILDQEIVDALTAVAPYLLDGGWFHVPSSSLQTWGRHFELLSSVSISNAIDNPESMCKRSQVSRMNSCLVNAK